MIKIDRSLLAELGLGDLPDDVANDLLRHIYETLEIRVGKALAQRMTKEQLDEFDGYFDSKDDAGAFKWLESHFPDYKETVSKEFSNLRKEIADSAEAIWTSAVAQAQRGDAADPPGP